MAWGTFTVDRLLDSIKKRAAVPISQITFTDQDLLNFANEEMDINLVPLVLSVKEEFYSYSEEIPLVSGQNYYDVPYRAIGTKLRDLSCRDPSNSASVQRLARINPEDRQDYNSAFSSSQNKFFYLKGDGFVLLPDVTGAQSNVLEVLYYIRPNDLVESKRVGTITSIVPDNGSGQAEIFLTKLPSNITIGSLVDFISGKPNHSIRDYDIAVVSVDSSTKKVVIDSDDLPDTLVIGDDVASAGETRYVQLPADLHVVLAESVASRILAAQGDMEGVREAEGKLQQMSAKAVAVIDTRSEGSVSKIYNPHSFLRNNGYRRRRG